MNIAALIPALSLIVVGAAMMFLVNNTPAQRKFVVNNPTQNRFLAFAGGVMGAGGVVHLFLVIVGIA